MENLKYGECPKHPNNSMINCVECNINNDKLKFNQAFLNLHKKHKIMEKLNKEQKVSIISNSDEIMTAVRMLIALMEDADLKNNITIGYDLNNENYELSFTKTKK
jgi:hypothetical protein